MKKRTVVLLILLILLADQLLKIWIKTSFPFGHVANVAGNWFQLYFIENKGMAWGMEFGAGEWAKTALTIFRLIAVVFGTWYLGKIIKEQYHKGFIICGALIYTGALGNLIDSLFYGMIFGETTYGQIAQAFPTEGGYAGFLHGHVVDMLYFPIIKSTYPTWFPFVGGEPFEFFSPIFNIADAAISTGVIALFVFQKRFMKKEASAESLPADTETTKE